MFRDMTGPITIHKSKSCPADFTADELDRAAAALPRTPPVSNGSRRSSKSTSESKKTQTNGRNGNGTLTMNVTMTTGTTTSNGTMSNRKAIPGRPRRRGNRTTSATPKRKKDPSQSIRYRLMNARWMKNPMKSNSASSYTSLIVAVFLWYSLGVISITTSNLLMMKPLDHVGGIPPLFLTLQQLIIGTTVLRFLLHIRFLGTAGIQPWPSASAAAQAAESRRKNLLFNNTMKTPNNSLFR